MPATNRASFEHVAWLKQQLGSLCEEVPVQGDRPLILDDPGSAYLTLSDHHQLFCVGYRDGRPYGRREHLALCAPGQLRGRRGARRSPRADRALAHRRRRERGVARAGCVADRRSPRDATAPRCVGASVRRVGEAADRLAAGGLRADALPDGPARPDRRARHRPGARPATASAGWRRPRRRSGTGAWRSRRTGVRVECWPLDGERLGAVSGGQRCGSGAASSCWAPIRPRRSCTDSPRWC